MRKLTDKEIAGKMRWWAYLAKVARRSAGPKTIQRGFGGKFNHDQENARRVRQAAAGILQMHETLT